MLVGKPGKQEKEYIKQTIGSVDLELRGENQTGSLRIRFLQREENGYSSVEIMYREESQRGLQAGWDDYIK